MTSRPDAPTHRQVPRPATWALFAVTLSVVMALLTIAKGVVDSDHFWHLATGQLIATSGSIPSVDPFSFTWAGQPWVPYSWLSELILYAVVSSAGNAGVLILFSVMPGVALGVLAYTLSRVGARTAAIAVPALLAGWTVLPYVTLRPQVISWVLMTVVLSILILARPGSAKLLVLLPALIALWANLHGGWVIGMGVIGLFALMTLLGGTPMAAARRPVVVAAVACVLAAGLTPAGLQGILYPLGYLDPSSWALEQIAEWQSPNFHDPTHWPLIVFFVALALNRGRATPPWLAVLPIIGIVMSLNSIRNAPFLAMWALPTLALGLEDRLRVLRLRLHRGRNHGGRRRGLETALALTVIVASLVTLYPGDLPSRVSAETGERFPVAGTNRLRQLQADANVLADYNWGGFVIARLYGDGGRVFVDGRDGEMYSDEVLEAYTGLARADVGWEQQLDRYSVEAILMRPVTPLVRVLAFSDEWCEAYRDDLQVLLLRGRCPPG